MSVPLNFVYLVATLPMVVIWLIIFHLRKDLKREILVMSVFMAFVSVITSYYWWTVDWWQPPTIWGTKVGIEDVLTGFAAGGLMTALYEVVFKKKLYKRRSDFHKGRGLVLFILLNLVMILLFYGFGLASFVASSISIVLMSALMLYKRKDLIIDALGSGVLMALVSLPSYYIILLIHPGWIDVTYSMLSGYRITGIPAEEIFFWFLAGFLFGPFYEYWQGERLRRSA